MEGNDIWKVDRHEHLTFNMSAISLFSELWIHYLKYKEVVLKRVNWTPVTKMFIEQ
jgi:hypothetical protein